jgi:hypothetical protein
MCWLQVLLEMTPSPKVAWKLLALVYLGCTMWKSVIFPMAIVAASWVLVSGTTTYFILWLTSSYQKGFEENVEAIYCATRIQESAWRMLAEASFMDETGRSSKLSFQTGINLLEQEQETLKHTALTPPELELARDLDGHVTRFKKTVEAVLQSETWAKGNSRRAVLRDLWDATTSIAGTTEQFRTINQQLLLKARKKRESATTGLFIFRASILVCGH